MSLYRVPPDKLESVAGTTFQAEGLWERKDLLEGRTLYRDAFRMLGIAKTGTFNEFGRALEIRA